jgi:hypothetical protein
MLLLDCCLFLPNMPEPETFKSWINNSEGEMYVQRNTEVYWYLCTLDRYEMAIPFDTVRSHFCYCSQFYTCHRMVSLLLRSPIIFVCRRYCLYVYAGFDYLTFISRNTRWRGWLRHCASSRKVAGSIPESVIGILIDYGPGIDSVSNRNGTCNRIVLRFTFISNT